MKIHGTDARIGFDGVVPFISGDNKATSDESLYGFEKRKRYVNCALVHRGLMCFASILTGSNTSMSSIVLACGSLMKTSRRYT